MDEYLKPPFAKPPFKLSGFAVANVPVASQTAAGTLFPLKNRKKNRNRLRLFVARKNRKAFLGAKGTLGSKKMLRFFHLLQKISIANAEKSRHLVHSAAGDWIQPQRLASASARSQETSTNLWNTVTRDRKNHGNHRRDRILPAFLRPDIGQFSPHFGAISF